MKLKYTQPPETRGALALIVTCALALFLTGCAASRPPADYSGKPAIDITVNVTCTDPAMKFTGTVVADGQTKIVSGTGSGTFHATGHEILCSFKKTSADGGISLAGSTSDKGHGTCSTAVKFGGVRAQFLRTTQATYDIFSTF